MATALGQSLRHSLRSISMIRSARCSSTNSSSGRFWEIIGNTQKPVSKKLTPVDLEKPAGLPETVFDFTEPGMIDAWTCDTDKTMGGESTTALVFDTDCHATFSGTLSTAVPAGGEIKQSGYCLMRSPEPTPTLLGDSYYDWSDHNGVELELRGDGRVYIANIYTDGLQAEDIYQAAIYTRGGPLWQKVQIPFVDFLLTSYGYVQNEQSELNARSIKTFGILLADQIDGDFQLDIRAIRAITMEKLVTNHEAD